MNVRGPIATLGLYTSRQAASLGRYALEQTLQALFSRVPAVGGIAVRAVVYRLMVHMNGLAAIEAGVRLRFCNHIHLGMGSIWIRASLSTRVQTAFVSEPAHW